uniref:Methyltransferase-like 26 n=1 Tax=Angiostrongylus cantonensis TaxID=6313 RepID=A0A0K0DN24_ANGCA
MLRAAAAERNASPIADVLARYLFKDMKVLEISSGTGQHVIKFAEKFPAVTFQPSEIDARSLHSIVAYIDHYRFFANIILPLLFLCHLNSILCVENESPSNVRFFGIYSRNHSFFCFFS